MSSAVRVRVESAAITANAVSVLGTAVEVGDAATEWLERRVVIPALTSCGECDFCRRGAPQGCADAKRLRPEIPVPGHFEASARFLVAVDRIGEGAPALAGESPLATSNSAVAVLGSAGLTAYGAFCALGVAPGEPVVVVGDGTASALVRQIAKAKSAAVTTFGEACESLASKPWRAFSLEATESDAALLLAALPAGSSVAINPAAPGVNLSADSLAGRGISAFFAAEGHPDLLPELVALAVRRELDLDAVVDRVPAAEASTEAIETITGAGRAALVEL